MKAPGDSPVAPPVPADVAAGRLVSPKRPGRVWPTACMISMLVGLAGTGDKEIQGSGVPSKSGRGNTEGNTLSNLALCQV